MLFSFHETVGKLLPQYRTHLTVEMVLLLYLLQLLINRTTKLFSIAHRIGGACMLMR